MFLNLRLYCLARNRTWKILYLYPGVSISLGSRPLWTVWDLNGVKRFCTQKITLAVTARCFLLAFPEAIQREGREDKGRDWSGRTPPHSVETLGFV